MLPESFFAAAKKEKIIVLVTLFRDSVDSSVYKRMEKEFNKTIGRQKNIELELVVTKDSKYQQTYDKLAASGHEPDIKGFFDMYALSRYKDEYVDLLPYIERDEFDTDIFSSKIFKSMFFKIDGEEKIYGLPFTYSPLVIYYNKDIFERSGIPYPPTEWNTTDWTYDKLLSYAEKMTLDTHGRNASELDFNWNKTVQYGYEGLDSSLRSWVGKYFDKNGLPVSSGISDDGKTAMMNTPEWKRALKDFRDQMYKYKIRVNGAYTDFYMYYTPIGTRNCAMHESYPSWDYYFKEWDERKINWNVAALPSINGRVVSAMDILTFAIRKDSANNDKAWEVYKWLYSSDAYKNLLTDSDYVPAVKEFQAQWLNKNKKERPDINWQVLLDAADYADIPNNAVWIPGYEAIEETLQLAMADIISGFRYDVDELADELNEEVQGYLDEYWNEHTYVKFIPAEGK